MLEVSITTFRNHLPDYLEKVRNGEDVMLISRGKVIAKLTPPEDERASARRQLMALREISQIGDVVSSVETDWEAVRAAA